jgi:hypothetical protein
MIVDLRIKGHDRTTVRLGSFLNLEIVLHQADQAGFVSQSRRIANSE